MLKFRPILRWVARLASIRRKLIFESATGGSGEPVATPPVLFRNGDASDLSALTAREYGYDTAARAFGFERLRAGDRLVLGESAGRVVFYAWVMFGQMDLGRGQYAPIPPGCAYTYKLYTVPAARGRGICPAYYAYLKRELRALGYSRVIAWVEAGNRSSIRAHVRSGFHRAGCIWHIRLFFRSYPILRAGFSRNRDCEGAERRAVSIP